MIAILRVPWFLGVGHWPSSNRGSTVVLRAAPAYLLRSNAPGALGFGAIVPVPGQGIPVRPTSYGELDAQHGPWSSQSHVRHRAARPHSRTAPPESSDPVDRGNDFRATWWDKLCYCCSCSAIAHPSSFPTSTTPPRPAPRSPRPPNTGGWTGRVWKVSEAMIIGRFCITTGAFMRCGYKTQPCYPRATCFYTGCTPCFYTGTPPRVFTRVPIRVFTRVGLRLGTGASVPHPRTGVFERSLGTQSRLHGSRTVGAINALPTRAARYLLAIEVS